MGHHAGTVTVSASGQTRDAAIDRCCTLVREATGEDAYSSYSGHAPHWRLENAVADVVTVEQTDGDAVLAGVDVDATFTWRDAS